MRKIFLSILALVAISCVDASAQISAPTSLFDGGEAFYNRSPRYTSVTVNGTDVPVFDGYNRSGDYLEYDIVRYTSPAGSNVMTITCPDPITSISVSPLKLGIKLTKVSSNSYSFEVPDPDEAPYYIYARVNGKNLVILRDTPVAVPTGKGVWNVREMLREDGTDFRSQAQAKAVSAQFQEAIDAASVYGTEHGCRGVVYVPDGVYYLANITLKSNVELFLDEGAVLRATDNKGDYAVNYHKASVDRDGTWWITTVNDVDNPSTNVRISGRGLIDANGYYYQKRIPANKDRFCITALHVIHASDVEIDGVTVLQTSLWGTMIGRSENVRLTNVKFLNSTDGNENDGIDVMESKHVTVDRAIGIALDDPFSTKTWMGQELFAQWTGEPQPLNDVTFDHCVSWSYCGAFKMGHGAQQKQSNVNILNGVVLNSGRAIGIEAKYANWTPGKGGYSNVLVDGIDIEHAGGEGWLKILADNPDVGNPPIKDVTIRNINIRSKGSAGTLRGADEDHMVEGVTFENIFLYGNEAPVTSLAELNITNRAFYKGVTFPQADLRAADYLLEAEYFNNATGGSVSLFGDTNMDEAHGGAFVQSIPNGACLRYNEVDFGSGTASATLRALSKRSPYEAVFTIDSPDGEVVGRGNVSRSTAWADTEVEFTGVKGTHDLYITFNRTSGASNIIDGLNYIRLNGRTFLDLEGINPPADPVEVNIEMSLQIPYALVPGNAYQTGMLWSVVSGAEFIALDTKTGVVKGLKPGEAVVRVSSEWKPEVYADIRVSVVDKLKFYRRKVEAESADAIFDTYHYDSAINVGSVNDPEESGARGLNSCWNSNFAVYRDVDFLDGAVKVTVRKGYPRGSAMEMWMDPVVDEGAKSFSGGTKIAELEFPAATTGWNRWQTFEAPIAGCPAGLHTIVVLFKAGGGSAENQNYGAVNWYEFTLINNRGELTGLVPVEPEVILNVHAKKQLAVDYVPADVLDRSVVWSVVSSEPDGVAEVSESGIVKGLAVGKAVVRASAVSNPEVYADFKVTVEDKYDIIGVRVEAESATAIYDTYHYDSPISKGNVNDPEESGARGLNSCWHTNFAVYEDIDLNDGAYAARIRKCYPRGSRMEIWMDPAVDAAAKSFTGGTLAASVEFPKPDKTDWSRWQTFETDIDGLPAGKHTVVFRFLAGGGSATNQNYGALNWVEFLTLKDNTTVVTGTPSDTRTYVSVDSGDILVTAPAGTVVTVCSSAGLLIRTAVSDGSQMRIGGLAPGVYVVNGVKVVVG